MISPNDVFERVKEYFSLTEQNRTQLMPFCILASVKYTARLKRDSDASDARIIFAAAGSAMAQYLLTRAAAEDDVVSFSAGDVSVKKDRSVLLGAARELEKSSCEQAGELLRDCGFCFMSV